MVLRGCLHAALSATHFVPPSTRICFFIDAWLCLYLSLLWLRCSVPFDLIFFGLDSSLCRMLLCSTGPLEEILCFFNRTRIPDCVVSSFVWQQVQSYSVDPPVAWNCSLLVISSDFTVSVLV